MENEYNVENKTDNKLYCFVAMIAKVPSDELSSINDAITELAQNYSVVFRTQSMRYLLVREKEYPEDIHGVC